MTRTQSPFGRRPISSKVLAGLSTPPGRRTVKTDPLPGSLATVTSPPIMRASLRVMARPSPVPPERRAVRASAWLNSSNSFALLRGHSDAGIHDGKLDPAASIGDLAHPQGDLAGFGELAGITQEIEQDLPQPHGIDRHRAEVAFGFDDEAVVILVRELARGADHFVDQRRQIQRLGAQLELAGFDL